MSSSHTYQDSSFILGASKNLVLAYTVGMQKKKTKTLQQQNFPA